MGEESIGRRKDKDAFPWRSRFTLSSPPTVRQRLTSKDWEQYKTLIVQLSDEGKTAEEIVHELGSQGFTVTIDPLRKRLREWRPKYARNSASREHNTPAPALLRSSQDDSRPRDKTRTPGLDVGNVGVEVIQINDRHTVPLDPKKPTDELPSHRPKLKCAKCRKDRQRCEFDQGSPPGHSCKRCRRLGLQFETACQNNPPELKPRQYRNRTSSPSTVGPKAIPVSSDDHQTTAAAQLMDFSESLRTPIQQSSSLAVGWSRHENTSTADASSPSADLMDISGSLEERGAAPASDPRSWQVEASETTYRETVRSEGPERELNRGRKRHRESTASSEGSTGEITRSHVFSPGEEVSMNVDIEPLRSETPKLVSEDDSNADDPAVVNDSDGGAKRIPIEGREEGTEDSNYTLLHGVAIRGDVEKVEVYSRYEPDLLNQTTANGWTALHFAVHRGHPRVVEALIRHGANVDLSTTNRGLTPLMIAASKEQVEITRLLLKAGAKTNSPRGDFRTPLFLAAYTGNVTLVSLLIESGADLAPAKPIGQSPLKAAIAKGHLPVVGVLLAELKRLDLLSEVRATTGWTPLHEAAKVQSMPILQMLLNLGADVNATATFWVPGSDHETECLAPVHVFIKICFRRWEELKDIECQIESPPFVSFVKLGLFLDRGAGSIQRTLSHGRTLLHLGAAWGFLETLFMVAPPKYMDDHSNLNLNSIAEGGHAALHYAAYFNQNRSIEVLLEHGAKIDIANDDGRTPLMIAIRRNKMEAAGVLIRRGANVNARDARGNTPLILANLYGSSADIVRTLLEYKANTSIASDVNYFADPDSAVEESIQNFSNWANYILNEDMFNLLVDPDSERETTPKTPSHHQMSVSSASTGTNAEANQREVPQQEGSPDIPIQEEIPVPIPEPPSISNESQTQIRLSTPTVSRPQEAEDDIPLPCLDLQRYIDQDDLEVIPYPPSRSRSRAPTEITQLQVLVVGEAPTTHIPSGESTPIPSAPSARCTNCGHALSEADPAIPQGAGSPPTAICGSCSREGLSPRTNVGLSSGRSMDIAMTSDKKTNRRSRMKCSQCRLDRKPCTWDGIKVSPGYKPPDGVACDRCEHLKRPPCIPRSFPEDVATQNEQSKRKRTKRLRFGRVSPPPAPHQKLLDFHDFPPPAPHQKLLDFHDFPPPAPHQKLLGFGDFLASYNAHAPGAQDNIITSMSVAALPDPLSNNDREQSGHQANPRSGTSSTMPPAHLSSTANPGTSKVEAQFCCRKGCNKTFTYEQNRTRHESSQHADELLRCDVDNCNKTFSRKDNLKTHKREQHGVEKGSTSGEKRTVSGWDIVGSVPQYSLL